MTAFLISRAHLRGEWADARGEPFDWRGSLVYAGAILLLIAGASSLDQGLWAWLLLAAGIVGIGFFLRLEAETAYPVLNVALLRHNRIFALSNLAALLNYAATFGVTFFLSLYLQFVKGLSPQRAGTLLIVQPIAQTILSPFCGRLADRFPPAHVATIGMALCALALGLAAGIDAATSTAALLLILLCLGIGFALFSSPNTSAIMGSVEARYLGVASGLNSEHAHPRHDDEHDDHHHRFLRLYGWPCRHPGNARRVPAQHAHRASCLLCPVRCRHLSFLRPPGENAGGEKSLMPKNGYRQEFSLDRGGTFRY